MTMKLNRVLLGGALFCSAVAVAAAAAEFPTPGRPITLLLGFPAGGAMDSVARAIQMPMEKSLGATIVIDYRPGAGGNIASQQVAMARPDGHTLVMGTGATHGVNATLYKNLPFDVEADFTPVAAVLDAPNVLAINPAALPAANLEEMIAKVKAAPGKYNYASTGLGTSTHLVFAELAARAGLDMVHVPFKGGPDAMTALLRGDVCCIFTQSQLVQPQWKAGKVRLLGVSTAERLPTLAEIPTISEAGLPGFESSLWFGIFGPKNMDKAVVDKLSRAVKSALDMPEVQRRLLDLGNMPRYENPEKFRATVKADREKWAQIVKTTGVSGD